MPCSLPFHAIASAFTSRRLSVQLRLFLRLCKRIELKLTLLIRMDQD